MRVRREKRIVGNGCSMFVFIVVEKQRNVG